MFRRLNLFILMQHSSEENDKEFITDFFDCLGKLSGGFKS